MQQLTNQPISDLKLIEQNSLQIVWASSWYQEDIIELSQQLLTHLSRAKQLEHNQGADRESIRFSWQKGQFVLHFDYYSQSCWLEGLTEADSAYLPYLQVQLAAKLA